MDRSSPIYDTLPNSEDISSRSTPNTVNVKSETNVHEETPNNSEITQCQDSSYRIIDTIELNEDTDESIHINSPLRNDSASQSVIVLDDDDENESEPEVEYLGSYSVMQVNEVSNDSKKHTKEKYCGDCPVCLEDFTKLPKISTVCGHVFCVKCMYEILMKSNTCPTCRNFISFSLVHPIYI